MILSLWGVSLEISPPLWCGSPGLKGSPSLQALLSSGLLIYSPTSISILSPFKKFPSVLGESLLEPGSIPGISWIWINIGLYSILRLQVGEKEDGEGLASVHEQKWIWCSYFCFNLSFHQWDVWTFWILLEMDLVIIFFEHKRYLAP